jgi:toxin FitB
MSNIADSSIWLEFFIGTERGKQFRDLLHEEDLLMPSITIFEVFKRLYTEKDETTALSCLAQMRQKQIVDLNDHLSVIAAKISAEKKLPMADAIIYATALIYDATLWTQDADFNGLPNVKYFPKKS